MKSIKSVVLSIEGILVIFVIFLILVFWGMMCYLFGKEIYHLISTSKYNSVYAEVVDKQYLGINHYIDDDFDDKYEYEVTCQYNVGGMDYNYKKRIEVKYQSDASNPIKIKYNPENPSETADPVSISILITSGFFTFLFNPISVMLLIKNGRNEKDATHKIYNNESIGEVENVNAKTFNNALTDEAKNVKCKTYNNELIGKIMIKYKNLDELEVLVDKLKYSIFLSISIEEIKEVDEEDCLNCIVRFLEKYFGMQDEGKLKNMIAEEYMNDSVSYDSSDYDAICKMIKDVITIDQMHCYLDYDSKNKEFNCSEGYGYVYDFSADLQSVENNCKKENIEVDLGWSGLLDILYAEFNDKLSACELHNID